MQRSNTIAVMESCSQTSFSNGGGNPLLSTSTAALCTSDGDDGSEFSSSSTLFPRLISGSIGSIVTALAVTPLEVVKIRQQMNVAAAGTTKTTTTAFNPSTSISSSSTSSLLFRGVKIGPSTTCPGCGTVILNNGLMDCVLPIESTMMPLKSGGVVPKSGGEGTIIATLLSIFRNEGISSLYAGLRPTLAMSVPNTVLYFTAYDEISTRLRQYHSFNRRHHHLAEVERQSVKDNNNNNNSGGKGTNMTTDIQGTVDEKTAATATSDDDAKQQAYIPLVAGSTARLVATMATAPLELIRTRQASIAASPTSTTAITRDGSTITAAKSSTVIPGMLEELKFLTRTRGISSLYAGLAPTLWRDVPFSAFYWLFFERFRNALSDVDSSFEETTTTTTLLAHWGGGAYYRERGMKLPPSLEAMHAFVAGAAAGSIAAALTTPFDVVKTRQQMVGGNGHATLTSNHVVVEGAEYYCGRQACAESIHQGRPPPPPPPPLTTTATAAVITSTTRNVGTFGCMSRIVQNEGISALWKGNVTRMLKIAPACAIMISCYELGKRVFEV